MEEIMNIFENIKNYFKRIFSKQKKLTCGEIEQNKTTKKESTFMDSLQKERRDFNNKKSILDEINGKVSNIEY